MTAFDFVPGPSSRAKTSDYSMLGRSAVEHDVTDRP
jgi:hypothetical protein